MILNLLDCATTLYAISLGAVEVNPLMAWAIEGGIFPLLKVTLGTWGFRWLKKHKSPWYWVLSGVYALTVINNLIAIGVIMK